MQKKQNNSKRILLWIGGAFVLIAAGVLIGILCLSPASEPNRLAVDPSANPWSNGSVAEDGTNKGIKIPGYSQLYIPADTQDVQITLLNPQENECYFMFELFLEDESTPLYKSDLVEPGKAIEDLHLQRALQAGTYTLRIHITPYAGDRTTALNGANVTTTLVVG